MGWFRRTPKPEPEPQPKAKDAIDDLCESLTERWWEWSPTHSSGGFFQQLTSLSGVVVQVSTVGAWIGYGNTCVAGVPYPKNGRVVEAAQTCLIRRLSSKKAKFADTANALADAIKAGDATAAIGLADWVKENLGETQ